MPAVLTLLGAVSVRGDEGPDVEVAVPTTKALDLLRLVAGAGQHGASASRCIELLWPSADEARGRMSLRTALAQLRRALGPGIVHRDGDLLRIGAEVTTDVDRLRRDAARVGQLQAQGDDAALLELVLAGEAACSLDLGVSGGSCEAVYALREELRQLACGLLLDGASAAHRLGRTRESLRLAQAADRLCSSEASARALMVAWAGLGETQRVVAVFDRLRSTLHAAYGVQPSPQTRAVYLQVVTAGDGLSLRATEHHRDVVVDLASTILGLTEAESQGGLVWLHGEPGAGRGVVAREAVRLIRSTVPEIAASVLILPEVIGLDAGERERLGHEALTHGVVLVIPVRRAVPAPLLAHESVIEVEPLGRQQFHDLLEHLLQESPAPYLEERLWSATGGLAGHATRTIGSLVEQDALRWLEGRVEVVGHAVRQRDPAEG